MKKLIPIFFLIVLFAACKKESTKPPPNLEEMLVTGFVFDSTAQKGLANAPVMVVWRSFYGSTHLVSGHTDAQGAYSLTVPVDTTRFAQEELAVLVNAPDGFIASNGSWQVPAVNSLRTFTAQLSPPRVVMFAMAQLTISFRRRHSDSIDEFESYYEFWEGNRHSLNNFARPVSPSLYISYLNLRTAAGIPTRVHWTKKLSSGSIVSFKDSIIALPGRANEIMIDY